MQLLKVPEGVCHVIWNPPGLKELDGSTLGLAVHPELLESRAPGFGCLLLACVQTRRGLECFLGCGDALCD